MDEADEAESRMVAYRPFLQCTPNRTVLTQRRAATTVSSAGRARRPALCVPPPSPARSVHMSSSDSLSPEAVASLRHELRTPVNVLIGYAEMILETDVEPGLAQALRTVVTEAREVVRSVEVAFPPNVTVVREAREVWAVLEALMVHRARVLARLHEAQQLVAPGSEVAADLARMQSAASLLGVAGPRRRQTSQVALAALTEERPAPTPEATRPAHILVVDDVADNVAILTRRLEKLGHSVVGAGSGNEALRALERGTFDLVLLDVVMPGLDGVTVLRAIRAHPRWRAVPVVMISALDDLGSAAHCIEQGAEDFLLKPFDPVLLRVRVGAALERTRLTAALRDANARLEALAAQDGLTGVANRRRFDEVLAEAWRACGAEGSPLGLLILDVDAFKKYNDHYGHQAGDACLQMVAQAIRETATRATDVVARYGGEEFGVICPGVDAEGMRHLAEAVCAAVRSTALPHAASPVGAHVTVSIGAAVVAPDHGGPADLIRAADGALYRAKEAGRDRCVLA